LTAIAGLPLACHRKSPSPPLPPPAVKSQPTPDAERPADAHPFPDPTFLVLVGIGSKPPGARIVRVSDDLVLGHTPDTIEFHQSAEPVLVRFELQGYLPVTREVSAVSDSELWVDLKPIPNRHAPASKRSNAGKAR